ncbi:alpha-N-acetylglucosaminidase [Terriglobus albidus]|uniref:alpha-N-acetylglucosaminidase n=1 Tax=Terriglobus albidus TaxID=1592106 RepID=UPI0021E0CF96|nr:alpha-N-acetylglucosaminidase [Terriglobus albidus]
MYLSRRNVLEIIGSAAAFAVAPKLFRAATPHVAALEEKDIIATARGLLGRVVPNVADKFDIEVVSPENGADVFGLDSRNGRIVLRGNNGVSIASALNHYLKYHCYLQKTWWDDALPLHAPLPVVQKPVRRVTKFRYRSYFNYCTFSYTAPWWDWPRWQREIDWMAMHGINMPLAVTGQEAVWQNTLRRFRMEDDEIRAFLCGPAFFAWQWMANLEGWGGPLPQSWIGSHIVLGRQILERERSFGMTPILQGFVGVVPRMLKQKFPEANIQLKPKWCNVFDGTAQLDPLDPLFRKMGIAFLEEQQKLFGTDHLYGVDPFHESKPPNGTESYLQNVAKEILATLRAVDTKAVIAMQTWSLRKPIVTSISKDNLILLDLTGRNAQKNQGFWDRSYVTGVLHNYGGRVFMGGSLQSALSNPFDLLDGQWGKNEAGIGVFPEGTEQNPVFYDAATEVAWMDSAPDASQWLRSEISARYGRNMSTVQEAWALLLQSLYKNGAESGSMESPICSRPALYLDRAAPNASFQRHYNPDLVWQAWELLQKGASDFATVDNYRFDLVDVARQALADLSIVLHRDIATAYERQNNIELANAAKRFLDLASDMDKLLGTRKEYLLGVWLNSAKKWATTPKERRQYERNARLQITVWGPSAPNALLFDYSNRQWSGLIRGYYIPRWRHFLEYLVSQPLGEKRFTGRGLHLEYQRPADDANPFYKELARWEQAWSDETDSYPDIPSGDSIAESARLLTKWKPAQEEGYRRYDIQAKPNCCDDLGHSIK